MSTWCSKHVGAWNKLIVKQKLCASSWLITKISNETVNQVTSEEFYFPSLQHKSTELHGTHHLKISDAMKKTTYYFVMYLEGKLSVWTLSTKWVRHTTYFTEIEQSSIGQGLFSSKFHNHHKEPMGNDINNVPTNQRQYHHRVLQITVNWRALPWLQSHRTQTLILLDHRVWKQNCQFGRHVNVGYACDATSTTDLPHTICVAANNNLHSFF